MTKSKPRIWYDGKYGDWVCTIPMAGPVGFGPSPGLAYKQWLERYERN